MLKEKIINIQDNGKALSFKVRQMPAVARSRWVTKAGLLLCGAGADIDLQNALQDFYRFLLENGTGVIGNIEYDKLEPLLNELLACCWRVFDRSEEKVTPETCEAYIEDFKTIFALYKEAFAINFLSEETLSKFRASQNTDVDKGK